VQEWLSESELTLVNKAAACKFAKRQSEKSLSKNTIYDSHSTNLLMANRPN
jgi:hypothetical protein